MEEKEKLENELEEKSVSENEEELHSEELNADIEESNNIEEYEEFPSIIVDASIDENDNEQLELRDLELKLQELEIKIDNFEFNHADIEKLDEEQLNNYLDLKEQYKKLLKEKRKIEKQKRDKLGEGSIEQSSPWIFMYGIVMDIANFPLLAYLIYLNFGSWVIGKFNKLSSIELTGFFPNLLMWLIIFLLPILLIALSWLLYVNVVKKKIDKKIFAIFSCIQILFTLITVIWLTIVLFF